MNFATLIPRMRANKTEPGQRPVPARVVSGAGPVRTLPTGRTPPQPAGKARWPSLSFAGLVGLVRRDRDPNSVIAKMMRSKTKSKAPVPVKPKADQVLPGRSIEKPRPPDYDGRDEMAGDSPTASARRRERARCEAIITSTAGQAHGALARKLAFESRVPRVEALQLLEAQPAPFDRAGASAARAARNPQIGTILLDPPSPKQAASRGLDAAFVKARQWMNR